MNKIEPIVLTEEEKNALRDETREIIERARKALKDPREAVIEVTNYVVAVISQEIMYQVDGSKVAVNKEEALEMLYRLDMSLELTNEVLYLENGIEEITTDDIESPLIEGVLMVEGLTFQGVLDKYRHELFKDGEVH